MEKLYIFTHCVGGGGQYTPQIFTTIQEARNVLAATYAGLRTNTDAICSEELDDDYAEIVYNDDRLHRLNIFEVDAPTQTPKQKIKNLGDCWAKLEKCKTLPEIERAIKSFSIGTGEWDIEIIGDNTVEVTNYYDDGYDYEEQEEIFYNIIIHPDQSYYDQMDRELP